MSRGRRIGAWTCVLGLLAAGDARAQQFIAAGRDTLRGLPGVEVLVEPIDPELERAGLAPATIRANVERQLRTAGIRIYATQDANPSPAKAYLYLQIAGVSMPLGGYALAVQAQVRQTLRSPVTQSAIVNAMSWDQQTVTLAQPGRGMESVYRDVQSLVGVFVQDWRAVH
jgi:hypothetical protein